MQVKKLSYDHKKKQYFFSGSEFYVDVFILSPFLILHIDGTLSPIPLTSFCVMGQSIFRPRILKRSPQSSLCPIPH